jgi:hypothetical protein
MLAPPGDQVIEQRRKIGLSMKNVDDPTVPEDAQIVDPTEPGVDKTGKGEVKKDLRGGTGSAGPLIQMPDAEE